MVHLIHVNRQIHSPPPVSEAVGPRYARAWIEGHVGSQAPYEGQAL
jgi:hypothetical protein